MKQIDLEPTKYRKQREGRWVQNINKPMCRWMAVGGAGFLTFLAATQPPTMQAMFAFAMIGVFIGALWVLSLRSTDW